MLAGAVGGSLEMGEAADDWSALSFLGYCLRDLEGRPIAHR